LWTGYRDPNGYGQIWVGSRLVGAHRLAYELTRGPIPPGTEVCHNCPGGDNPACCNPAHLFLDTHAGNMADKMAKGRHRYGTCRGEEHGCAKLAEAQVLEIRRLHTDGGITQSALAQRFSVARQTIRKILTGRSWGHLKEAV
jgi:DNA-binding XRE family transcriptional regulator